MRKLLLIVFLVPSFLQAQNDSSKLSIPQLLKEKVKSILQSPGVVIPVNNKYAYQTLPWLHKFLDTASGSSIDKFLAETEDSILQMVYFESIVAKRANTKDNPYSINDKDGDGTASIAAGGTDCDDLDRNTYRGNPEKCEGYFIFEGWQKKYIMINRYHDEDCNPCSISGYRPDGDKDMDGQVCFTCSNYSTNIPMGCDQVSTMPTTSKFLMGDPTRRYTTRGWDCDDRNPAIIRASQVCIDEKTIAVCENGKWKYYPCRKCVTQPNGIGVVVD